MKKGNDTNVFLSVIKVQLLWLRSMHQQYHVMQEGLDSNLHMASTSILTHVLKLKGSSPTLVLGTATDRAL